MKKESHARDRTIGQEAAPAVLGIGDVTGVEVERRLLREDQVRGGHCVVRGALVAECGECEGHGPAGRGREAGDRRLGVVHLERGSSPWWPTDVVVGRPRLEKPGSTAWT